MPPSGQSRRLVLVIRDALVGTVIAEYAVQDMVGEGGTAMVYRAAHPTHGIVALKVLRTKLRNDPTAVIRFEREAEFGLRVVHPNVVRTIELGASDGVKFLAIEWAPGDLLEKVAKQTGAFPRPQVASIVSQIAAAVDASHRQGIVHRDLKPENLMYDSVNDRVRLLDFGIAAEPEQGNDQRLTRDGFFVGTLLYVAPEALSGVLVGPTADQYSLATIAYFLLTGVHPYTARSTRDMLSQLLTQPPTPLNKAVPTLTFSDEVEKVVMKGLARLPGDRYPGITDFAAALEASLTSMPAPVTKSAGLFSRVKNLFGSKDR